MTVIDRPENYQENRPRKRGRPPKPGKSISVHCRVQPDLYQLLLLEQKRVEIDTGHKPALSAVLMGTAKKTLLND